LALIVTLLNLFVSSSCVVCISCTLQAIPKIFCAGLDIHEIYQPERGKLMEFWRALQVFWMKLYMSRLTTVAAINVCFCHSTSTVNQKTHQNVFIIFSTKHSGF